MAERPAVINYMRPMTASGAGPAGPDMGGMLMQGINAWQGMKQADAEKVRQDAMISALKGMSPQPMGGMPTPLMGPQAGGMGSMSMPTEAAAMPFMGGGKY